MSYICGTEEKTGILDICAINKISRPTLVKLIGSYKNGTYLENPKAQNVFKHRRVSKFRMEFNSPVAICIDGEIKGAKTINFEVVKNALNFVVPTGSELIM